MAVPYRKDGRRRWTTLSEYAQQWPDEFILYPQTDFRTDPRTCKWCGKPLKTPRQQGYCSAECRYEFSNATAFNKGTASLPYRILCRDNFTCFVCDTQFAAMNEHGIYIPATHIMDVHHLIEVKNGGTDNQHNLACACDDCHKIIHREEGFTDYKEIYRKWAHYKRAYDPDNKYNMDKMEET